MSPDVARCSLGSKITLPPQSRTIHLNNQIRTERTCESLLSNHQICSCVWHWKWLPFLLFLPALLTPLRPRGSGFSPETRLSLDRLALSVPRAACSSSDRRLAWLGWGCGADVTVPSQEGRNKGRSPQGPAAASSAGRPGDLSLFLSLLRPQTCLQFPQVIHCQRTHQAGRASCLRPSPFPAPCVP